MGKLSIEKHQIKVATKDGYILINEIQLPGKRKMKVKDLLNGLTVENEAYMLWALTNTEIIKNQ